MKNKKIKKKVEEIQMEIKVKIYTNGINKTTD